MTHAQKFALQPFHPQLLDSLKTYRRKDFFKDLMSGLTVAAVAIPLAMAFAIASGLKPENGLFTAIVAGFIISAFGGSRVQVGGPAGAFIVVVYRIVEQYGVDGLIVATLMAGVMLFCMGLFRLGTLVRFVPVSIVIGFTNGIAVLIALSQAKDFLGLRIANLPSEFFAKMYGLTAALPTIDGPTIALGVFSLLIVFGWPSISERLPQKYRRYLAPIPGSIVALAIGTILTWLLHLDVETIGTRFGGLPRALPSPTFPAIDFGTLQKLLPPAITIALLGAIESLLCARVADNITGDRHDPNQELMAQGMANVAAPLLGGYCATGTIARTMTNIRYGGRSPISGMIHAIAVLIVIMVAAPLAENVPMTTLAAILLYVSYNMGEWHEFVRLKHFPGTYRAILLSTFFLTVIIDLTVAVEVGLMLACLFFIVRVSNLTRIEPVPEIEGFPAQKYGDTVEAYRIYGSLFFGAAMKLESLADVHRPLPKVIILDMNAMLTIDATGLEALGAFDESLRKRGSRLVLCGLRGQALSMVRKSGFAAHFGENEILPDFKTALERAEALLYAGQISELA